MNSKIKERGLFCLGLAICFAVAGTSVNDTASVVASGYAFSEIAGDFATMVKLTRTLAIIPTVLVFAYVGTRMKKNEL